MNAQSSGTKRWQAVIPVIIIATNRRVDEAFPAINDSAAQILVVRQWRLCC